VPPPSRGGAPRLVDLDRSRTPARLRARISLPIRRRDLRGARSPVGLRECRAARLRHLRYGRPGTTRLRRARALPLATPRRAPGAGGAPVRRRPFLHGRPPGAVRRRRAAAPGLAAV